MGNKLQGSRSIWNIQKTTDELLSKLPSHIGRNKLLGENGEVIGYMSDNKEGGDIGWLYLHNDGKDWLASYGRQGEFVCLNPDAKEPPYINAFAYGSTPNEALQRLYDWCVKYNFIKEDESKN